MMKYLKPLKLYFYGFTCFLLALILTSLLVFCLSFSAIKLDDLFLSFTAASFLFMFYAGVYASSTIRNTYLNIKTNKEPIFLANILFAFILAITLSILLFGYNYLTAFYIDKYLYIVFAILFFGIYIFGNSIILFLKKINYIRLLTLITIIITTIFYKETISYFKIVINYILELENILQFNLRVLLISSLLLIINYLKY